MIQSKLNSESTTARNGYIGPYKIVREIAQDGVGQVFEAVDLVRKKPVAIKHLQPETGSPQDIEPRLYAEAETLGLLNHPHIARLFGFVRREKQLYLVMEFVEGESLQALLKRKGRLKPTVALALFHETLSAVAFAHRLGVIHGNLKSSNIMLTKLGIIKVLDFAVAPILREAELAVNRPSTARYRAPEQSGGGPVDVRSDVYSLGVLLYEMIVGSAPFGGGSEEEITRAKTTATPLPPSLLVPETPAWLDAFVLRALAVSPSDRFQSVTAMSQAVLAPLSDAAGRERPIRLSARLRRSAWQLSCAPGSIWMPASRRLGRLRRTLGAAVAVSREKCSRWVLGQARTAENHVMATKSTAKGSRSPTPWLPSAAYSISLFGHRTGESCKKMIARASAASWQRHTVLAMLLGAVIVEIFFFAGVNTLLRPVTPLPDGNDNGIEKSFPKVETTPVASEASNPPEKPIAKSSPAQPKAFNPRRAAPKQAEHQPQLSQSASLGPPRSAVADPAPRRLIPQKSRLRQPALSKADADRDAELARIQLNVEWEN